MKASRGKRIQFLILSLTISLWSLSTFASEVIEETQTAVVVREHPKTGRPYVSITLPSKISIDPFSTSRKRYPRPDYRLLDPKIKSGQIPYEGPYSDNKKIYIFAASLATLGTAGGLTLAAVAPAATGVAAASGGGAAYLAGGAAVATGSAAAAAAVLRSNPKEEDYSHRSESRRTGQGPRPDKPPAPKEKASLS